MYHFTLDYEWNERFCTYCTLAPTAERALLQFAVWWHSEDVPDVERIHAKPIRFEGGKWKVDKSRPLFTLRRMSKRSSDHYKYE